jgi:hypothetical protein
MRLFALDLGYSWKPIEKIILDCGNETRVPPNGADELCAKQGSAIASVRISVGKSFLMGWRYKRISDLTSGLHNG